MKKVLIIDDEASIAKFVSHSLEAHGYQVVAVETGKAGLQAIVEQRPEVVILDYGLPDMSGIEVLRQIREWSKVPVLFLTVRDSDEDKVLALDTGADDYLTKPFSVPELLARLRVAIRHSQSTQGEPVIVAGPIEIDRASHLVRVRGVGVKLTATEFTLLNVLASHLGRVVAHRTILSEVWGPNSVEQNHYLRVYFGQIRKKLEMIHPGAGDYIATESGVGYRLKNVL